MTICRFLFTHEGLLAGRSRHYEGGSLAVGGHLDKCKLTWVLHNTLIYFKNE